MKRIPDEQIAQIRQATDLVELISERVELKKQGQRLVGLCPFHSENTPSFSVSPEKGMYHCFGCGAGGNAFTFVMETEGLSFPEAVEKLAVRANIEIDDVDTSERTLQGDQLKRKQMRDAHRLVAELYHEVLFETEAGEVGLTYLLNRDLSEQTIRTFKLGFAPDQRTFLVDSLTRRGFDLELMVEAGLIAKTKSGDYYDRFEGRVVFPVSDRDGTIVGFSGRSIDGRQPKYVNTSETPLFNKSELLFGFSQARATMRKTHRVVLVEGNVDVLQIVQAGTKETVAALGTAFSAQHARALSRIVEEIVLCFDGDTAGQEATLKAIRALEPFGIDVQVLPLPPGEDPDSWIRAHGSDAWQALLENERMTVLDFMNRMLRRGKNLKLEGERVRFIESMLEEIGKVRNSLLQEVYLKKLAVEFDLPLATLSARLPNRASLQQPEQLSRIEPVTRTRSAKTAEPRWMKVERLLLHAMLHSVSNLVHVRDRLGVAFHDETNRMLATALYTTATDGMSQEEFERVKPVFMEKFCNEKASYATRLAEIQMMSAPSEMSEDVLEESIRVIKNYEEKQRIEREKRDIVSDTDSIEEQALKLQQLLAQSRRLKER